jgi:hypothetical protein
LLDGYTSNDFALKGGDTFTGAVNFQQHLRLSTVSSAPAYQSGYCLIYLLDQGSGSYGLRAKIRSSDGTKFSDTQLAYT